MLNLLFGKEELMVTISHYLDPKMIIFLNGKSRDDVIKSLVDTLVKERKVDHNESLFDAIIEREKIVTTGIGMGVAIPHAKLQEYDDFFIAVGILDKGVDWDALDNNPVRLVFLIGGPDDKQTEYLQILSSLTLALKDEERRKKILNAKSPEEVVKLFEGF
ncbi:MAG: PTS system mannose-specific EIIBCA component [Chlamydiae bacterium]|nr:PTS system mannose-specific EIIBCA component [Chlamydiota bacterium]